jgi:predicted transcriptional regulator
MEDLFIRRVYTRKNISVVVDIDLINKTISLVERKGNGFVKKNWLFAERELKYMDGWQNILDAMSYAISEARKVLEAFEERNTEELLKMFYQLDKAALEGKK